MSSSKVLSSVAVATQRVPIGTSEFIERYQRELEENSTIGQRIKMLEERHQIELQRTYQKAFADGENAGLERGLAASRKLENELRGAIVALANYHNTIYQNASAELLEMAFALANKIVLARGEAEKQIVLDTINACLREVLDKTRLTVKVNPAQSEFVKNQVQSLGGMNEATSHITVESDSRVRAGGCIIETDSGNADGRLENQLQVLHEKLLELQ
ncbi:MAG: FliH/SctL family protein [Candidatus Zixiibacteriota bacterium]